MKKQTIRKRLECINLTWLLEYNKEEAIEKANDAIKEIKNNLKNDELITATFNMERFGFYLDTGSDSIMVWYDNIYLPKMERLINNLYDALKLLKR